MTNILDGIIEWKMLKYYVVRKRNNGETISRHKKTLPPHHVFSKKQKGLRY
jgi:hypothetical protein